MYKIITPEIRKSRQSLMDALLFFCCNTRKISDEPAFRNWDKLPQQTKDDLKDLKPEHIDSFGEPR